MKTNNVKIIKKLLKRRFLMGFVSLLNLLLFSFFGEYIFEYFKNSAPIGSFSHTQDLKFLFVCFNCIFLVFIPRVTEFIKLLLDLILKKQKTIIVTGIKKTKSPWDMREDYVIFYGKGSAKLARKFVVFKDVYSLKGKKVNNTYEITYYAFSKVVIDMKKCAYKRTNQGDQSGQDNQGTVL